MTTTIDLDHRLAAAWVDQTVFDLRPDYRVMLLAVDGLVPRAADAAGAELIKAAEAKAATLLAAGPVDELGHVASWREAYRSFGAKPQRTRNSLEALLRRAEMGLPRVNALTDVYNAVSVLHQVPVGGEDLSRYSGTARLVRATGDELFDTVTNGAEVREHPDAGEVIWRDDLGVTCRRWNWRQGRRTALSDDTRSALFIFDALAPMTDDELEAAAEELAGALRRFGTEATVARRLIAGR